MRSATAEECRNFGQAQRKKLRRRDQQSLDARLRRTTALALLEKSMRGRVPALIKLKRKLMAESPFAYFRGAAPVMAADLAAQPNTGILCQLCGDAHVRNLGVYAAPDGRLIFDINDFDETAKGPFEWDLKRMSASLVLAGRAAKDTETTAQKAVTACVNAYCASMREFSGMAHIDLARFQVHRIGAARPVHAALLKAERATPLHTLAQLTEPISKRKDAPRRFRQSPPMLTRVTGTQREEVLAALKPYSAMLEPQRQHLLALYQPVDVAFKVVGTGSVGLRDYCIYFEGNGPRDPLFLQIKEETDSAYSPYLRHARSAQNGKRVAEGQRAMQMQSDPFLGWTKIGSRQYLVRQLNDHKGSIELEDLAGENLIAYAEVCGELLARGHARSGDARVIAGYLGNGSAMAAALSRFAVAYADQTVKDWEELRRSAKVGG
jgi:uncharacterized protein (DUF2252 family)